MSHEGLLCAGQVYFYLFLKYLFIWLLGVLVEARGIFQLWCANS